jgi:hypothetical protein
MKTIVAAVVAFLLGSAISALAVHGNLNFEGELTGLVYAGTTPLLLSGRVLCDGNSEVVQSSGAIRMSGVVCQAAGVRLRRAD